MSKKPVQATMQAIAVFTDKKVKGTVLFTEDPVHKEVIIDIDLQGLKKNGLHGFHVHEAGDLSQQCTSMCAHLNPYGKTHGCPGLPQRHVGDLGNLKTDAHGCARYRTRDNAIKLRGVACNIIGRGLIVHADEDDCGQGGDAESLKTGNAGKRIACAVIGYSQKMF